MITWLPVTLDTVEADG